MIKACFDLALRSGSLEEEVKKPECFCLLQQPDLETEMQELLREVKSSKYLIQTEEQDQHHCSAHFSDAPMSRLNLVLDLQK